jgi:formylglycine-generating enzyme required for sulfatase activity
MNSQPTGIHSAWQHRFFAKFALVFLAAVAAGAFCSSFADTVLEAKLTPTIVVNGPLGSLQQIQYSTNLTDTNGWTVLTYLRLDSTPKPFYDAAAGANGRFYRTKMVGVADTNLVWIPAGTFLMGSPTNELGRGTNEGPQTLVTLTHGFFIGRYEVKNSEFLTDSPDTILFNGDSQTRQTHPQHAVRAITHPEADNYCAARTLNEQATGRIPTNWTYRLPTEAEWEYACRAGTTTPLSSGGDLRNDSVRADAAFDGNFPYPTNFIAVNPISYLLNSVPPVGSYAPNAFGLYDMHGGAREWCQNTFGNDITRLPGGSVTNPSTLPDITFVSVFRGGGAYDTGVNSRSASRRPSDIFSAAYIGFRVVLIPSEP